MFALLSLFFLLGSPAPEDPAAAVPAAPIPDRGEIIADIDSMMQNAISTGALTGAVVYVGHENEIILEKAYGKKTPSGSGDPADIDTIFDLASLTKVVATAPAIMALVEEGKIKLDDPIGKYLPETATKSHREITVRQVLTHYSGLTATVYPRRIGKGRYKVLCGKDLLNFIYLAPVETGPGKEFIYSDLGYMLLGKLIERRSGMRLDHYVQKKIYGPLQMKDTGYCPDKKNLKRISFSEEERKGYCQRGTVQDPIAGRLNGISGHAGLFSTVQDLSRFAKMMLNEGTLDGQKILSSESVAMMISPQSPQGKADVRGLGWDIDSRYSSLKGEFFPESSFGHTGYTGTSLWIDPKTKTYVILLTCRPNLGDNLAIRALRTGLSKLVGSMFYTDKIKEKGL
jgi:CubicO group peptidase (beta-lactamase class C family)